MCSTLSFVFVPRYAAGTAAVTDARALPSMMTAASRTRASTRIQCKLQYFAISPPTLPTPLFVMPVLAVAAFFYACGTLVAPLAAAVACTVPYQDWRPVCPTYHDLCQLWWARVIDNRCNAVHATTLTSTCVARLGGLGSHLLEAGAGMHL